MIMNDKYREMLIQQVIEYCNVSLDKIDQLEKTSTKKLEKMVQHLIKEEQKSFLTKNEIEKVITSLIKVGQFKDSDRDWLYSLNNEDYINLKMSLEREYGSLIC